MTASAPHGARRARARAARPERQNTAVETTIAAAAPVAPHSLPNTSSSGTKIARLDAERDVAEARPPDRDRERLRPAPDELQRRRDENEPRGRRSRARGTRSHRRSRSATGISIQNIGTATIISGDVPTM